MAKKAAPVGALGGLFGLPDLSGLTGTSAAESGAEASAAIGDFIVGGTKAQLSPLAWLAIAAAAVAAAFFLRG